jgi:hypothetical protein
MKNPFEFLQGWTRDNVRPTAYNDKAEAERLSSEYLQAAKQAGLSERSAMEAAGGKLDSYMLSELNGAVNTEEARLASKRD